MQHNKIPILLLVRELGIGGTERQLVETALLLKASKFEPHVACFRPNGLRQGDLIEADIPILHLPVTSFRSLGVTKGARLLLRYLRQHGIQIVHSFDAPLNVFTAPVVRFFGDAAVVTSQRGHRDLTGEHFKTLLRMTDRLTDAILVNCQWMSRYLIEEEGVPETRIRLCYNAIDLERYHRSGAAAGTSATPVIGTVCALRPEKGVDTLLRAFAKLQDVNAKLLIVGSGPQSEQLHSLAAQLELGPRCHFEPATADVTKWLSQIDLFVLPSRFEALSNSLMEAMACSCCVVATRVGGNPELIEDGYNGLLFPVDDATELAEVLRTLVANPEQIRTFAARACAKVQQFSYERTASTLEAIYDSVLTGNRGTKRHLAASNA